MTVLSGGADAVTFNVNPNNKDQKPRTPNRLVINNQLNSGPSGPSFDRFGSTWNMASLGWDDIKTREMPNDVVEGLFGGDINGYLDGTVVTLFHECAVYSDCSVDLDLSWKGVDRSYGEFNEYADVTISGHTFIEVN